MIYQNDNMNYYLPKAQANQRVRFDPTNPDHRLDYAKFLKYNRWSEGCHYYLEEPFTDIPTMINYKLAVDGVKHLIAYLDEPTSSVKAST